MVVDNASSDGSAEALAFPQLPLEVRRNRVNRGFAAACNQGAAGSRVDYLLFLNPDIRLSGGSVAAPLAFLERPDCRDIGILGIQLVDEAGVVQRTCARFPTPGRVLGQSLGLDRLWPRLVAPHFMREWAHDETRPVDQVMGAYFLVRREIFEALGGFDERFFVYFDDVDFCFRARERGWLSVYFAGTQAAHTGGGTTAAVPDLRLFYNLRSRLLFARKHFRPTGQIVVLAATVVIEPVSRVARAIGRGSAREARQVGRAVTLLWSAAIRGSRAGPP